MKNTQQEVLNMSEQSIITDYTRTWLRSFSDADSIAETAHSADIRNAAT